MKNHDPAELIPREVGDALFEARSSRGWRPARMALLGSEVLLRARSGVTRLFAAGAAEPFHATDDDPLIVLESVLRAIAEASGGAERTKVPSLPVAVVAASYEFGRFFEPHHDAFPYAAAGIVDDFFAAIHREAWVGEGAGWRTIGHSQPIPAGWMAGAPALGDTVPGAKCEMRGGAPPGFHAGVSKYDHREGVGRIRDAIREGGVYQVNLSVPWDGATKANPAELFQAAHEAGGGDFAAHVIAPMATFLSFSPELYLRRRGNQIETRPIKGTAEVAEGANDAGVARALLESQKDRSEHVMIVDLERNDFGRICVPGSVEVAPLMEAVAHPGLVHLESTVRGTLRDGISWNEIFAATFPGGSVTGAPKKRALEMIGELERRPRGIFCGALGWIDAAGNADLNLPIRTATFRPDGSFEFPAGGGIVIESDPAAEWAEIETKCAFFRGVLGGCR